MSQTPLPVAGFGWDFLTGGPRRQYTRFVELPARAKPAGGNTGAFHLKTKLALAAYAALAAAWIAGTASAQAQNTRPDAAPPSAQKLSGQERRGEGLFLQRCSLCHLPRKLKFGSPAVIGPSLSGQFRTATPEEMKTLRGFILKGGPDMPGFQYGLGTQEMDDLIAYLKTL